MGTNIRSWLAGLALAIGAACVFGSLACGPIRSTTRIAKAEVALERARVVEAYKKAPYEFFSARYYLHKSKEEWGYSEFEPSFDYAEQAQEAAESARRKSKEDPWKDPIKGREKSYKLKPQKTITIDPEKIPEAENVDEQSTPTGGTSSGGEQQKQSEDDTSNDDGDDE